MRYAVRSLETKILWDNLTFIRFGQKLKSLQCTYQAVKVAESNGSTLVY